MADELDLRADLHGRVIDFISDQDRTYFERHPETDVYRRKAFPHEMCRPEALPDCISVLADLPIGGSGDVWIEVRRVAPGVRTRMPYVVLGPEEAA